ncbi:hypothetical protein DOTSEDRAFT_36606 [Dothistroma septosporum NZE10]|uniref:Uncharacterized protein n=1 Tax=Dothistroma septosporum (strain NZE10 / CBS 128990) TaxID=675120 RepID=N1PEV5_DOTSN|nr:hypothetical protein DOTSEDRAFT_36606 [Dothistroma septosporum NZE10]
MAALSLETKLTFPSSMHTHHQPAPNHRCHLPQEPVDLPAALHRVDMRALVAGSHSCDALEGIVSGSLTFTDGLQMHVRTIVATVATTTIVDVDIEDRTSFISLFKSIKEDSVYVFGNIILVVDNRWKEALMSRHRFHSHCYEFTWPLLASAFLCDNVGLFRTFTKDLVSNLALIKPQDVPGEVLEHLPEALISSVNASVAVARLQLAIEITELVGNFVEACARGAQNPRRCVASAQRARIASSDLPDKDDSVEARSDERVTAVALDVPTHRDLKKRAERVRQLRVGVCFECIRRRLCRSSHCYTWQGPSNKCGQLNDSWSDASIPTEKYDYDVYKTIERPSYWEDAW